MWTAYVLRKAKAYILKYNAVNVQLIKSITIQLPQKCRRDRGISKSEFHEIKFIWWNSDFVVDVISSWHEWSVHMQSSWLTCAIYFLDWSGKASKLKMTSLGHFSVRSYEYVFDLKHWLCFSSHECIWPAEYFQHFLLFVWDFQHSQLYDFQALGIVGEMYVAAIWKLFLVSCFETVVRWQMLRWIVT